MKKSSINLLYGEKLYILIYIAVTLLGMLLLFAGCIHQYPDEMEEKDVTLDVELLPDREFIPLPTITKSGTGSVPRGYLPRVIVEARRTGETAPAVRAVMTVSEEELSKQKIALPVTLNLKSVPYDLTVWVDYSKEETLTDAHYNTGNLRSISYTSPYEEDYTRREAFFGNASVDCSGGEGKERIQVEVKRPLAHYRIVATDVRDFLDKQHANGRPGAGEYEVTVSYRYFLVTHLDAVTGEPVNSGAGFGYTRRISITDAMERCELAADYVLANDKGSTVTVAIEVKDGENTLLSRTANIEIPYRRGHTTTVEGAFLSTKGGDGGSGGLDIGIDGDYEGEINIDTTH